MDRMRVGSGQALPASDVPSAELAGLLEPLAADLAACPHAVHVVPTAEGSISLEWRVGDVEYTAGLYGDRRLFLMIDDVVTDEITRRDLPYDPDVLRGLLHNGQLPR